MRIDPKTKPTTKKATLKYAVESKCHDCMTYYADGKQDCENTRCPLYPWMPYRQKEPNLEWTQYSPKRIGLATWDEIMPPERREALARRAKESFHNGQETPNSQADETETDEDAPPDV